MCQIRSVTRLKVDLHVVEFLIWERQSLQAGQMRPLAGVLSMVIKKDALATNATPHASHHRCTEYHASKQEAEAGHRAAM